MDKEKIISLMLLVLTLFVERFWGLHYDCQEDVTGTDMCKLWFLMDMQYL